jgi:hypothetical protein
MLDVSHGAIISAPGNVVHASSCARNRAGFYNCARMHRLAFFSPFVLATAIAACGGSPGTIPTAPAAPPATAGPVPRGASAATEVRLVDAIGGTPVVGASVSLGSRTMPASDGDGCSTVWAERAGRYALSFGGNGFVTRTTSVSLPAPEVELSLIPSAFPLPPFDEMFRSRDGRLQRWTTSPRLVIVDRELQFSPAYANDLTALRGVVSDRDQQETVSDLSAGFAVLTDHRLGAFASIATESPAIGSRVTILRTGAIVVVRSRGLSAATGYWGMGQWATAGNGEVVAGYVLLDADFDGPACEYPQFRRSLRMHELGHALGYGHVKQHESVMNASARLEPTSWDLEAVHIAFQRPPGSTAPDHDPAIVAVRDRTLTLGPRIY